MGAFPRNRKSPCEHLAALAIAALTGLAAALPAPAQTAAGAGSAPPAGNSPATPSTTRAASTTTAKADEATADSLVELGRQAADLKKYEEAQGLYRRALGKDPRNIPALAGLAAAFVKQNNLSEALRYYLEAAKAGIDTKRLTIAEQMLHEAAGVDPHDTRVLFALAQVFAATGRDARAIEMYRRYLKSEQNDYRAHLAIGKLYLASKYYRQAISSLRTAESLNAQYSDTLVTLAKAYRSVRDYAQAEEMAARPVATIERTLQSPDGLKEVSPDVADYYSTYAGILLDSDKVDEAERQGRRGLEVARLKLAQSPEDLQLLQGMVELYKTLESVVQKQLTRQPEDATLLAAQARLIGERADVNLMIELYRAADAWVEAAKRAPDDLSVLRELATVQYRIRKSPEAAETCRKILALRPDDAFAKTLLEQIGPVTTQPASATQAAVRP